MKYQLKAAIAVLFPIKHNIKHNDVKARLSEVGLVTAIFTTIAVVNGICNNSYSRPDRVVCAAGEAFRWSDQACYVSQGE